MRTGSRFLVLLFLTASLVVWAGAVPRSNSGQSSDRPSDDTSGVAVVELFTSQGCSSCPPADRLLRSLVASARSENRPIYALSFHVDYWNRLGWEDPYSDAQYSRRQQTYARALQVDTYTPQVVVNGRRAMVGSRKGVVRTAVKSALKQVPSVTVNISATVQDQTLAVNYHLSTVPTSDTRLHVALVERGLSNHVPHGENAGRTLRHANVVRQFASTPAMQEGAVDLYLPSVVDRSKASVIAYVQSPSMAIHGAARLELASVDSATSR